MKFVNSLSEKQIQELRLTHRNAPTHRERQRAHVLLLSAKGYTLNQLADIFDLDRDTLSVWLDVFAQGGVAALADAPKSGRPRKLDEATRAQLVRTVREQPTPQAKTLLLDTVKKTV
jgi:transposase